MPTEVASVMSKRLSHTRGQAMTEFTVAAAFVLVPVFLLIPLVGKYIDLRQTSVQSARHAAWERTVWFERSPNGVDTIPKASTAPSRSDNEIERVAMNRVLGHSARPISNADWQLDMSDAELNPLWRDHRSDPLVTLPANDSVTVQGTDQDLFPFTPTIANDPDANLPYLTSGYAYFQLVEQVENGINGLLGYGETAIGQVEDALGNVGINVDLPSVPRVDIFSKYHLEGFYAPQTALPVNNVERLASFGDPNGPFDNLNLVMRGQAALIADGWTAQGSTQFAAWTDDYVPTRAIAPVFRPIQRAIELATVPVLGFGLAPELATDSLELGKIHMGPVPTSDAEPDCPEGVCSYD